MYNNALSASFVCAVVQYVTSSTMAQHFQNLVLEVYKLVSCSLLKLTFFFFQLVSEAECKSHSYITVMVAAVKVRKVTVPFSF
jgi:hypothetical protein